MAARDDSFYRRVWRWHFIAGVLVGPLVFIVAVTGALYVFKRELEPLLHGSVLLVDPTGDRAPLDRLVTAAEGGAPGDWRVEQVEIDSDPRRSVGVVLHGPDHEQRRLYVDPYRGEVLGEISPLAFFPVVLRLHRDLFVGTGGRLMVELATGWTIVLLATGLYLWWPRTSKRNRAVWLPTFTGPPYRVLRDWHAVAGFWALPLAATIAITGLVYSYAWGTGFQLASYASGAYDDVLDPPERRSSNAAGSPTEWEAIYQAAATHAPDLAYTLLPPPSDRATAVVMAGAARGPSMTRLLAVDPRSGEVILDRRLAEFPALAQWASWNYPLHTGSVLGLPTKIAWLVGSVVLALMPVTGYWMWWRRRPPGKSGWPRRVDGPLPLGVKLAVFACSVALPVAGFSLSMVLCYDYAMRALSRRRETQLR
ncbi:MAG: PepSY-associated TM helix domain-containing protein [Planctomycetota bacterium]